METNFSAEQIEGIYKEDFLIQVPVLQDEAPVLEKMGLDYDYVDPDMRSHNWLQ